MLEQEGEFHILVDRVHREEVIGLEDKTQVPVAQLCRLLVGQLGDGISSTVTSPSVGVSSEPMIFSSVVLP